ncbi:xylose isomerase [Paenibacillus selenitireducens]|uniref:Xylose isomerase n=1 Tax=Paenibacillus selenitireducens TaxID=1324314 RepID=A0A1T2X4D5_9BACL|nr:sugar phosphate isomerase/epimerase [Paenibacillus selenitireducens]OPA74729.1 xylose isomerase [Paenibacillus selenitireducens]
MRPFKGRIAAHTITWGQDHIKALEEVSMLGYKGIEPWASFALQYEEKPEQLQEILAGYGLEMTALYGGTAGGQHQRFGNPANRSSIIEYNVRLAKIIAKCGADILVLGPGGTRNYPSTLEELKVAAVTMNEVAKRTYALGVKSCVHPHLWTELQDENELEILMSLTDPKVVCLAPDSAHLLGAGMDPASMIRTYQDRVAYVHLKDLTAKPAATHDIHLPYFCELGKGSVDLHGTIEALNEIDYSGWVTLEVDESPNTPYNTMEICRDFVEEQLKIPVRI